MSSELLQIGLPDRERPQKRFWRSLAELSELGTASEGATPEFPEGADEPPSALSRRTFLQLLGASTALAGCSRDPSEKLLPYTLRPKDVVPGIPNHYATSMVLGGYATGLIVESHEGRPTKIEGNPDHPASLGGTGIFEQASVLDLYNPQRARQVLHKGHPSRWETLVDLLRQPRTDRGAKLRLLLEPTSSPLLLGLLDEVRRRYPAAQITFYEPFSAANEKIGTRLAFGGLLLPQYDLARAEVILSLNADFLGDMPFHLRYARAFAERRRPRDTAAMMNRLYMVESMLSVTGSMADHRLRRRPSEIAQVAGAVAAELPRIDGRLAGPLKSIRENDKRWTGAVAKDLAARAPGTTLVMVGPEGPPALHALGYAMNAALGNIGHTLSFVAPVLGEGNQDLAALVEDLRKGEVDTLVVLGGNPVYTAPADYELGRLVSEVETSVYLGMYENETSGTCGWFAPGLHYLESWGDARAYDGTLSLVQPLISPLFGGRGEAELIAAFLGEPDPDGYRLLRRAWATRAGSELDFQRHLKLGFVERSAAEPAPVSLRAGRMAAAVSVLVAQARSTQLIELDFRRSPTVHDGRFLNNPWLLEQPHPITKITWDNAALLSVETARRLGVDNEGELELKVAGRALKLPAFVVPGHADGAITLEVGWGQAGEERFYAGAGFDTYRLLASDPMLHATAQVKKVGGRYRLAQTQMHWDMHDRPIALSQTLAEYRKNPTETADLKGPVPTLFEKVTYEGLQWAMSIDLSVCTGCSACMLACQSENNVLVVGKEDVLRSREMHWIRIDSYYSGTPEDPKVVHQPMMCQHCENAPCEYVCPVNATVHSPDGLNEMVYNRCVGTRFCSNNCPYKVRRFNWFKYIERAPFNRGMVQLQHNPEVTVRERGVMEKCTYCVQRIRRVEIDAQLQKREVRPNEVVTACAQACPTGAIQFGSLSHPDTKMVEWRRQDRSYAVLHDQGTQPRTMYLTRVDNPNPELG